MDSPFRGLASPVIGLVVGPQQQRLSVHRDLLLETSLFKHSIEAGRKGLQFTDNTLFLPNEDPTVVAELVRCVYCGSIAPLAEWKPQTENQTNRSVSRAGTGRDEPSREFYEKCKDQLTKYINLYTAAGRCASETIQNQIMDTFISYHQYARVNVREIVALSQAGRFGSPLKLFLIRVLARQFGKSTSGYNTVFDTQEMERLMPGYMEKMGLLPNNDMITLLDEIGKIVGYGKTFKERSKPWCYPTTLDEICAYHKHKLTRRCGEPAGMTNVNPPESEALETDTMPGPPPYALVPSGGPYVSQLATLKRTLGVDAIPPTATRSDAIVEATGSAVPPPRSDALNRRKRARLSDSAEINH